MLGREKIIKMNELNVLRKKVDELDHELLDVLKRRLMVSMEIGNFKKKNGLKIRDRKREGEILQDKVEKSSLNGKFIQRLFKLILNESRRIQK
jgi:chorismate mutase